MYLPTTCSGATAPNGAVRDAIGVRMAGLGFEQRWLVVDIATDTDLGQGTACTKCARRSGPPPT